MAQRKGEGTRGEAAKRTGEIIKRLRSVYPDARLELEYDNAFQLLIEAILAAQESDKKINALRESLFSKYQNPEDFLNVPLEDLEKDISSINFFRRKAKLIKRCCEALVKDFGGEVPQTVEEMVKLPGVGRKTANMVLGGAFGLPAIVMDRHVLRVSGRIGLTKEEDPDKAELELREIVPRELWTEFSMLLLNHGKNLCTAKAPRCERCPINDLCDSSGVP